MTFYTVVFLSDRSNGDWWPCVLLLLHLNDLLYCSNPPRPVQTALFHLCRLFLTPGCQDADSGSCICRALHETSAIGERMYCHTACHCVMLQQGCSGYIGWWRWRVLGELLRWCSNQLSHFVSKSGGDNGGRRWKVCLLSLLTFFLKYMKKKMFCRRITFF